MPEYLSCRPGRDLAPAGGRGWRFSVTENDLAASPGEAISGGVFTQLSANTNVRVKSTDNDDSTQTVFLIGIDVKGQRVMRAKKLTGTTQVEIAASMALVETAFLDKEASGSVVFYRNDQSTFIGSIAIGNNNMPVAHHFSGDDHLMCVTQFAGYNTTGALRVEYQLRYYPDKLDARDQGDGFIVASRIYLRATVGMQVLDFVPPIQFPGDGALIVYGGTGSTGTTGDGGVEVQGFDVKMG